MGTHPSSMKHLDYKTFAQNCVRDLKLVQSQFQKEYDLDGYENWFYNQATGLLTFTTNEVEINFKYLEAGSFSQKSNTWLWSWANDDTLDNVKHAGELIKTFGEKSDYAQLTNGYFESNEFEAWEFTAIVAKLTNAIGVYRPVNDEQLQIYLVITEFVDNETAQNIKDKYVQCNEHEYRRIAFVCKHLNDETRVGFQEAFETFEGMELADEDDFQAWCNECELVRQQEGEWNEKSMEFAQIRIVCEKCYFEMKELNLGG